MSHGDDLVTCASVWLQSICDITVARIQIQIQIQNDCQETFVNHNSQRKYNRICTHYNDIIMGAMVSQIASLTIVCSAVYSMRRWQKTSKLRVSGLCAGTSPVTGEFPAQRASNAANVSIWWRHHVKYLWFYREVGLTVKSCKNAVLCYFVGLYTSKINTT